MPTDHDPAFDTILMAINGVTAGQAGGIKDKPSIADVDGEAPAEHKAEASDELEPSTDSEEDELDQSNQAGAENGECRLLGPFALIVQTGLGLLALFSLVWKRWRERPRRPMKVWFFDVSKQVVGSALLHLLNVLMSMISSKEYQLASSPKQVQDEVGRQPNPCSFYLINIAVDVRSGASCTWSHSTNTHADDAWHSYPGALPQNSPSSGRLYTSGATARINQVRALRSATAGVVVGKTIDHLFRRPSAYEVLRPGHLYTVTLDRAGGRLGATMDRGQRGTADRIRHVHLPTDNERAAVLHCG